VKCPKVRKENMFILNKNINPKEIMSIKDSDIAKKNFMLIIQIFKPSKIEKKN
jgi:hypothetical protein